MTLGSADSLALAFDAACGRRAHGSDGHGVADVDPSLLAFARRVVALGRLVVASPKCPRAAFERAQALFRPPTAPLRAILWHLLFDSWAGVAPATRGAGRPRLVRFGGENGSLHVEIARAEAGAMRLRGTLDGPRTDVAVDVARRGAKPTRVAVEPGGTFRLTLPKGVRRIALAVRVAGRTVARTPMFALRDE